MDRLVEWLAVELPQYTLEELARRHIDSLSEYLEEYIIGMFVAGHTRQAAAETLNVVAQRFGWLRSSLAGPWNLLKTWDTLEPVRHHPPIPRQVLFAAVTTALVWEWHHFAALMVLGFFALLRPSELIGLQRADLALPADHWETDVTYVRIGNPKTRFRGARAQHVRVDEPGISTWLNSMLRSLPPWRRIWQGSLASFKKRFELVQKEVLHDVVFLPSSLRPGGATFLFRSWGENLVRLQWRGRWRSYRMLEIYVQELGAAEIFVRFSCTVKARVSKLGNAFERVVFACRLPVERANFACDNSQPTPP